jgi:hypothetical protein
MRIKILVLTVFALSVMLSSALGADIAGTWKGTREMMGQSMEVSFTFVADKSDAAKFTGTSPGRDGGENKITAGKIDGANVSFTVVMEGGMMPGMKINYKGAVAGDEMKLTMEMDMSGVDMSAMGGGMGGPPAGGGGPGGGGGMGGPPGGGGPGGGMPPMELTVKKVK